MWTTQQISIFLLTFFLTLHSIKSILFYYKNTLRFKTNVYIHGNLTVGDTITSSSTDKLNDRAIHLDQKLNTHSFNERVLQFGQFKKLPLPTVSRPNTLGYCTHNGPSRHQVFCYRSHGNGEVDIFDFDSYSWIVGGMNIGNVQNGGLIPLQHPCVSYFKTDNEEDRVVIFAGRDSTQYTNDLYWIKSDDLIITSSNNVTWTQVSQSNTPSPRGWLFNCFFHKERLWFYGGHNGGTLDGLYSFSPYAWQYHGNDPGPRYRVMTIAAEDYIYIIGGIGSGVSGDTVFKYGSLSEGTNGNFTQIQSLPYLWSLGTTQYSSFSNSIYVMFGNENGTRSNSIIRYSIDEDSWNIVNPTLLSNSPVDLFYATSVAIDDLVFCGFGESYGGFVEDTYVVQLM